MNIGDSVTDGTAVFKLKSLKQPGLIGEIKWYAGKNTPVGYLVCDGSAVSRTNYSELFAAIGTTYGTGNGSTTFNLPCLTDGRFVEGNATPGTKRNAGLPNITGNFWIYGYQGTSGNTNGAFCTQDNNPSSGLTIGTPSGAYFMTVNFNASRVTSLYGSSSTVQPKSITFKPLIKYI